jgi:hypothetical protein
MMLGIWIFLLQAPPQKVQWWMWTLAIFFFLIGLGLLIYLMTRPKLTEQEEELESKPRKVLSDNAVSDADVQQPEISSVMESETPVFSDAPPASPAIEAEALPDSGTEILASSVQSHPVSDEEAEVKTNQTAALWNQATPEETEETVSTASIKDLETVSIPVSEETVSLPSRQTSLISGEGTSVFAEGTPTQRQPDVKETVRDAGTQVLASKQAVDEPAIVTTAAMEADEVWQDLDFSQSHTAELATPTPQAPQPPAPPVSDKGTRPYNRVFPEQPSASVSEPSGVDTLRTRAMREAFEPPRIEPIASPSQSEVPLSSTVTPPAPPLPDTGTQAFSSTSRPTQVYSTESSTREFPAPQLPYETPVVQPATHPEYETAQHGRINRPAGSVLGLPVDAPHTPLILGQPVKSRDEIGVTGFSNYDKPQDAGEKRRGGLIAILIVVALMGGGALAYFRVPSVHGFVDRLRGAEQPKAMDKARAQIIPAYPPEVNKKMVKAKGAVVNTSDQTLENLTVEVALYRGAVLDKTITIPVTPEALEAGKQGEYVFEYDGGSAGYSRYSITKLTSNGSEVKFSIPKP